MDLDLRKQRILSAVVQDYVLTAEPVGSQILVERYALGVKSATVRNELAELSERGFLRQPHTSAGRVPSDRGYRFYVNRLMPLTPLGRPEAQRIQQTLLSVESEFDAILRKTCQLLNQLTQLPAVVTSPEAPDDTRLRQVFLSPTATDKALLMLLFSTGRTEHRLLPDVALSATEALTLTSALNARLRDKPLSELRRIAQESELPPVELAGKARLWQRLVRELVQVMQSITENTPVFVEGTRSVLAQPEFRDVERLSQLFVILQERAALLELLHHEAELELAVRIGEELGRPELACFAVVSSPYFVGTRERGSIGVIGPTRMDYSVAAVSVRFLASTLSELLTQLAVSA
ncbi:heat-inducible transcriptional repressor HrcA [Armatimonas sp.]|uniref:heat-inducible transcriptional repressor HrcA n=1 Tax=Armatimonas sp. TaxID=1872638 RepID=UPI003753B9B0